MTETLYEAWLWTAVRTTLLAVLAVPAALTMVRFLQNQSRRLRGVAWWLLLLPYFTPAILIGYAYERVALAMIHHDLLRELAYSTLVFA
jgi:ABC-type Fe3+ transport system permease subunit